MKKFTWMCLCILLGAGMLAGCGTSVSSEQNLVYVDKKGGVVSVDVETLDAGYYSEEELETFIEEEVDSYTGEHGKGSVSLEELKVEDGKAKLTMKYKTTEDYTEFNGIELYQGKIVKALAAGYDFKTDFSKVEDGKVTGSATTKEIYATEDLKVVIIKANTDVQVAGDICYVSNENVKLTGNDTVSIRKAYGSAAEDSETVNESTEMSEVSVSAADDGSFETDVYTYIIYK
ncbi:MAG: hypothetical protein J5986_07335 [Roseburia sp.]|nr:hypothetical protein [Roseburia sp.]